MTLRELCAAIAPWGVPEMVVRFRRPLSVRARHGAIRELHRLLPGTDVSVFDAAAPLEDEDHGLSPDGDPDA